MLEGIKLAKQASENAYAPYSNFRVGAAIQLNNGTFFQGANVENGSYGLTSCAERNTLFQVYNKGFKKNDIKAIYIYAYTKDPISPCGACRQVMYELMPLDAQVYLISEQGNYVSYLVKDLLPYGFKLDE